jgi:hypothetical protein
MRLFVVLGDVSREFTLKICLMVKQKKSLGNDLLSHPAAGAVPSALAGLTTGFGM